MARSLLKVTKKVSKKKGNLTSLHENSRDSQSLRRAAARDDKVARATALRAKVNQPYLQRVAYLQGAASAVSEPIDITEVQRLVESYVRRDEDELQQVKAERRPGRPASTREDLLNRRIASDAQEYNSGYWIPDVTDDDTFKKLQSWTGEWSALGTIKFVRLTREGLLLPSSFPPKGQS